MAPKAVEQKAGKSKAEKKPVKVVKAEKKPVKEGGKKKKRAKSIESYKMYIYKVLKQVSVSVTEFGTLHCLRVMEVHVWLLKVFRVLAIWLFIFVYSLFEVALIHLRLNFIYC